MLPSLALAEGEDKWVGRHVVVLEEGLDSHVVKNLKVVACANRSDLWSSAPPFGEKCCR